MCKGTPYNNDFESKALQRLLIWNFTDHNKDLKVPFREASKVPSWYPFLAELYCAPSDAESRSKPLLGLCIIYIIRIYQIQDLHNA